ncbi:hypothetical protein SARC_14379, partial [Sphaeroforma arctica JP610]
SDGHTHKDMGEAMLLASLCVADGSATGTKELKSGSQSKDKNDKTIQSKDTDETAIKSENTERSVESVVATE